jgi:hypothetical protein
MPWLLYTIYREACLMCVCDYVTSDMQRSWGMFHVMPGPDAIPNFAGC